MLFNNNLVGVIIQTLEPGMVYTKFLADNYIKYFSRGRLTLRLSYKLTAVSAKSYVSSAINTIGWSTHCQGHLCHYLFDYIRLVAPNSFFDKMVMEVAQ